MEVESLSPSPSPYLSVVVPVYNEGMKIEEGIRKLETSVLQRYESELILVDDGSVGDKTPPYEQLIREKPFLRVLRNSRNRGKGHAIKKGISASRGTYIFYTDADVAYDLNLLPAYLETLENGAELAIGCRIHPDSYFSIHPRYFPYIYQRQVMGATFNYLVNRILKLDIKDTQCGFKCLNGELARSLFPRLTLDGFAFEVELLFLASRYGHKIQQMPVRLFYHGHPSSVRMVKDSFGMFLSLLWIWKKNRDGYYDP